MATYIHKRKRLNQPKISIITPSYNQGKYIESTIKSVLAQDYPNFEHIIIDGGSTDNTIQVIKKYPHLKWISEKDNGQSDAFNKGLKMSTGEIIGWINSDDFYKPNIFDSVVKAIDENVDWIIGNICLLDEVAKTKQWIKSPEITLRSLQRNPHIVRQQGAFFKKSTLVRVHGLDPKLELAMDYDLWLKLVKVSTPTMIDSDFAYFRLHAIQKTTGKNRVIQAIHLNKIMREHHSPFVFRFYVLLSGYYGYLKYIIKKILIRLKLLDSKFEFMNFSQR